MSTKVAFQKPPALPSKGRNGTILTHGVVVTLLMESPAGDILIEPVTSRGKIATCRIVLPAASAVRVAEAILQEYRLWAERRPQERISERVL